MSITKTIIFVFSLVIAIYAFTGCGDSISSVGGYIEYKSADIPDIHYDGSFGLDELNEQSLPKVLFDSKKVGDIEVYLLGEYVRTDKSENDNAIYSYRLKIGIEKDDVMETCPIPSEFEEVSQGGYVLNKRSISDYLCIYEMDCPLIVLRYTSSSGADLSAFYAVKDGSVFSLMGDSSAIGSEAMGVCVPSVSEDTTVLGNTLKDNASGVTYIFNFDNILRNDFVGAHFIASFENDEPKQ